VGIAGSDGLGIRDGWREGGCLAIFVCHVEVPVRSKDVLGDVLVGLLVLTLPLLF
jgi:hypothetical protein